MTGTGGWWLGTRSLSYRHFERSEKSSLQSDKRCMCEHRNTVHQDVVSLPVPM